MDYLDHYKILANQDTPASSPEKRLKGSKLQKRCKKVKRGKSLPNQLVKRVPFYRLENFFRSDRGRREEIFLFRLEEKVCLQLQRLSLTDKDKLLESRIREVPEEEIEKEPLPEDLTTVVEAQLLHLSLQDS